eukprot:UN25681
MGISTKEIRKNNHRQQHSYSVFTTTNTDTRNQQSTKNNRDVVVYTEEIRDLKTMVQNKDTEIEKLLTQNEDLVRRQEDSEKMFMILENELKHQCDAFQVGAYQNGQGPSHMLQILSERSSIIGTSQRSSIISLNRKSNFSTTTDASYRELLDQIEKLIQDNEETDLQCNELAEEYERAQDEIMTLKSKHKFEKTQLHSDYKKQINLLETKLLGLTTKNEKHEKLNSLKDKRNS